MEPKSISRARQFYDWDESASNQESLKRRRHFWPRICIVCSNDDEDFLRSLQVELEKMCYAVADDDEESHVGGQEAAGSSQLVVIVLSEKFLETEACMIKLRSIPTDSNWLCLFYELRMEEFLGRSSLPKWRETWAIWQKGIEVDDEAAWRSRLQGRALDCSNGNTTEVIKFVAQTISSSFIPLQVYWCEEASHIQGRARLCQEVDDLFFKGPLCDVEPVRMLGLHGMWSVGKTSLAKALCDFYRTEFQGRVYHAELFEKSSHFRLVKDILCHLLGAKGVFLEQHLADLSQAYAYLDHCLKQSSDKVFLVVDNIQDSWECLERARELFLKRVPFPKGSMIVCLARSSHTLERLFFPLGKPYHIECVPSINQSEGHVIFKREASPREGVDCLLEYVDKLSCTPPDFIIHPLILKSLGCSVREKGAEYWLSAFAKESVIPMLENLGMTEVDNALREVFKALREIYNSLDRHGQQLFVDVALYVPRRDLSWLARMSGEDDAFGDGFGSLQKLRATTLLTVEERKLKMHVMCRRFAAKQARTSDKFVYVVDETVGKADVLCSRPPDAIERIAFDNCNFENGDSTLKPFTLDLSMCERLQVLRLLNVKSRHVQVDVCLGHSKLVTLEILSGFTPVVISGDLSYVRCFSYNCGRWNTCSKLNLASLNIGQSLEVFEMYMDEGLKEVINMQDFSVISGTSSRNAVHASSELKRTRASADVESGREPKCGLDMMQSLGEKSSFGDFSSTLDFRPKKRLHAVSSLKQGWGKLTSEDAERTQEPMRGVDMAQKLAKVSLGDFQSFSKYGSQKWSLDTRMEQHLGMFKNTSDLEVLQVGGSFFCQYLSSQFWSTLRQLTLFCINGVETTRVLDSLPNLRALHVQELNDLLVLDSNCLRRLQELHVIECNNLHQLILPCSEQLTHCCIWFCNTLWQISQCRSDSLEAPVTGTGECQEEEVSRYHPCPAEDAEIVTCSVFENHKKLVRFSPGSRFSFRGCRSFLESQAGGLIFVGAFEVRPVHRGFAVLPTLSSLRSLDQIVVDALKPASSSGLSIIEGLRMLEVMNVKINGFLQKLFVLLQKASSCMESLAVRCHLSKQSLCGCKEHNPDFSLLKKSLLKLTYECIHVTNLASIGSCNRLRQLELISCFSVFTWPEPSQMERKEVSRSISRRTWRRVGALLMETTNEKEEFCESSKVIPSKMKKEAAAGVIESQEVTGIVGADVEDTQKG